MVSFEGISYGVAESIIINVLLWWLPVAASALPLAYMFNSKDHLHKWVHYWKEIPRMHGSTAGFLWILLNVAFGTASGLGIWLLRDGDSFSDNTVPLILNYVAMAAFAAWTLPVLMAYSKNWATFMAVGAAIVYAVLVVFGWIHGPWYAGLTLTLGFVALALILLMWVMPLSGKAVSMITESWNSMKPKRANGSRPSYTRM